MRRLFWFALLGTLAFRTFLAFRVPIIGDEAYYVLKGMLTERVTDVNQKTSSKSREVTFKAFPSDAGSEPSRK